MWYISIIIFVFGLTLAYCNIKFSYWKRKEIRSFPATIPWGSFKNIIKNNVEMQVEAFYKYFHFIGVHYGGIYLFTRPLFMPVNNRLIQNILTKDFVYFSMHCSYHNMKDQKISRHLYNSFGYKWKNLSTKVRKVLSFHKLKILMPTLVNSFAPLVGVLELYAEQGDSVDAKKLVENIIRDVYINSVLGMESNSDFEWFENVLLTKSNKELLLQYLKMIYPNLARYYGALGYPKEAEEFFAQTVLKFIKKRHKNSILHADLLQLLMEMYNHEHEIDNLSEGDKLSMYDIINQCFFFYIHGYENTVKVLSFALYELSRNQYVQNKIRMEIWQNMDKSDGNNNYEHLNDLKYLEQVLKEILRKYPPIKVLDRKCTRKYKLPNVDKYIEKGENVLISISGIHKNEKYYADPEKFDPDRFAEKTTDKNCTYLSFGDGPRRCPGQQLAITQLKLALVLIIQNFQFYLTPGGTNPLEDGLMLRFHKVAYNRRSHIISCNFNQQTELI